MKAVPLKIYLFAWRLLLNNVPTKDNLVQRRVLSHNDQMCTGGCGRNEDMDYLFVSCGFYGKIWLLVLGWLGLSTVAQGNLMDHLARFGGL